MSATEAQLRAWVRASGRNWHLKCQALAWQLSNHFGHAPVVYPSAIAAYHASKIVSTDASKAPAAAFHYFAIGVNGHVGPGLGGARFVSATANGDVFWDAAKTVSVTTVARYCARTGARYLGWSLTNGANDFAFATPKPAISADEAMVKKIAAFLNAQKDSPWRTTAAQDGKRGPNYWGDVQYFGKHHTTLYGAGYIVDREPGGQSRKVEQFIAKKIQA